MKKVPRLYDESTMRRLRTIIETGNYADLYSMESVFKKITNLYRQLNEKRKRKGKEPISEEEFIRSMHEDVKNWPEDLRRRAEPILNLYPKPPEGPLDSPHLT